MSSRRALLESLLLSRLPSAFQEVEYIESTGTQYIDTQVSGGSTGGYEISFLPTLKKVNYQQYLAGDLSPNVPKLFAMTSLNTVRVSGSSYVQLTISTSDFNVIKVKENGEVYYNNSLAGNISITDGFGILSFYVFNSHAENNLLSAMKLKYLIMIKDNVIVRNFVPCYRKADNVAGLYDLVNGVFYTNAGTGTFIVGGNV